LNKHGTTGLEKGQVLRTICSKNIPLLTIWAFNVVCFVVCLGLEPAVNGLNSTTTDDYIYTIRTYNEGIWAGIFPLLMAIAGFYVAFSDNATPGKTKLLASCAGASIMFDLVGAGLASANANDAAMVPIVLPILTDLAQQCFTLFAAEAVMFGLAGISNMVALKLLRRLAISAPGNPS